jgi:N-methylhydantoinase B
MHATGTAKSVTMGLGIAGGFPGTGGYHWHATDTAVQQRFAEGRLPGGPQELRELAPHGDYLGLRQDNRLSRDDVFELMPNPGAGWGDTLARDPVLVANDLRVDRLSREEAEELYGVVVDDRGEVDLGRTAECRGALRRERLERARAPRNVVLSAEGRQTDARTGNGESGETIIKVIEGVAIQETAAGRGFVCASCEQPLAKPAGAYRRGCCELDLPLGEISNEFLSPIDEVGEALVFRRFLCPGCGAVVDSQICRPADEPFEDVALLG